MKKEKFNLATFIQRLNEDTPDFFKKMRKIGLAVGLVSGAVIALPVSTGIALPALVLAAAKGTAAIGTTIVSISSLTSTER